MEATQAGQINAQQTIHRHLRPLTHQPRTRTLSEWPISLSECHWEGGRIPGAIRLELFTEFTQTALSQAVEKNEEVVIYCMGPG